MICLDGCSAEMIARCGVPDVEPIDDPTRAVVEALRQPLDYPPLADMTTPGDRVVVAVGEGVPAGATIVSGVVRTLVDGGVAPDGIVLLRTAADAQGLENDPRSWLPEPLGEAVGLVIHDPTDRDSLAYLATTEQGQPVFLNRTIVDADLVLPIGCFRHATAAGCYGIHAPVYPTFSDRATRRRFFSPETLDARGRRCRRLVKEADEVGWLLGIDFSIQVIPGPGDRVFHILAGQATSVRHRAMELDVAIWHTHAPRRAELVVAAVEGSRNQQTWLQVGRALATGAALVEPGGALAVCCELADPPGMALRGLSAAASRNEAIDELHRLCHDAPDSVPEDALPAIQLAAALDHCRVLLLSQLDDSTVEELDITPVARVDEIVRLAGRCQSYVLLGNASHVTVSVDEEE